MKQKCAAAYIIISASSVSSLSTFPVGCKVSAPAGWEMKNTFALGKRFGMRCAPWRCCCRNRITKCVLAAFGKRRKWVTRRIKVAFLYAGQAPGALQRPRYGSLAMFIPVRVCQGENGTRPLYVYIHILCEFTCCCCEIISALRNSLKF